MFSQSLRNHLVLLLVVMALVGLVSAEQAQQAEKTEATYYNGACCVGYGNSCYNSYSINYNNYYTTYTCIGWQGSYNDAGGILVQVCDQCLATYSSTSGTSGISSTTGYYSTYSSSTTSPSYSGSSTWYSTSGYTTTSWYDSSSSSTGDNYDNDSDHGEGLRIFLDFVLPIILGVILIVLLVVLLVKNREQRRLNKYNSLSSEDGTALPTISSASAAPAAQWTGTSPVMPVPYPGYEYITVNPQAPQQQQQQPQFMPQIIYYVQTPYGFMPAGQPMPQQFQQPQQATYLPPHIPFQQMPPPPQYSVAAVVQQPTQSDSQQ